MRKLIFGLFGIMILAGVVILVFHETKEDKLRASLNKNYDSMMFYFNKSQCCWENRNFDSYDYYIKKYRPFSDSVGYYYYLLHPKDTTVKKEEPPKPKCNCE